MTIRKAGKSDVSGLLVLYRTLFNEMAALQPLYWRAAGQNRDFFEEQIDALDADILIAESGGALLGFAVVQERETPPFPAFVPYRYAYLMDMVVSPVHRSAGTGGELIDAAEEWASARDLGFIELNVLAENTGAKALYERKGFGDVIHTMRKSLT